ncbi:PQQ-like beta-propeller repeat protein [Tuwongella immobilis]|uniref:Pyrrolo-quinoline quinone repeat domain-containing protein n=1 Tax=Tuwongella immobilis TaxID=692036 RepID=A0A6C2YUE5_9BACT|nr:PQQ-binding-like beta-propeller repeat protein [Tuwongella immobilis]VIP04659.1 Probable serine/threonine protein kinase related protein OS=Planctomyces maris DSM 8797 GN=PM8797T_21603 PE=4 SV=1: PQQ_2: PQQ_2 [Tuwongella immobilis]VTS06679.1 Probable serine/threonine protein kinase related protein OS=Planctomyces maris DSM 8797 GN=PM8797T_21603 PE=4 SV=1: PQQ_2: PQQ_2 [Tuwongella immobilis]
MRRNVLACLVGLALFASPIYADNWTHWRGPLQTGWSPAKNLPDDWSPAKPGANNLIWKQPIGLRSTPIVLNGKVVIITSDGMGQNEGEKVVCLDEKTGKVEWQDQFNVFHTDIVSSRVGWTSPTAAPELGYVYAHGTQGLLTCYDLTGKIIWRRSLTEEYGRTSGYGGRIIGPVYDTGKVIVGMVNSSWGNHARGGCRFYAFDAKTGEVVWVSDPCGTINNTHNSTPVVATINGERLLIAGAADGTVVAVQVHTGKKVWAYPMTSGVVNGSPIVNGTMVYVGHGDENLVGGGGGAFICLDASKIENGKPKLVWEYKKNNTRFGLANPAYYDGRIYAPDDFGKLYCFDAKKGKLLWKYNYGRVARGSPLIADNKVYIFEVNSNLHILALNGDEEPEETSKVFFRDTTGLGFVETNCTPCAVNGRVIFGTRDELFSIGLAGEPQAEMVAPEKPTAPATGPVAQIIAVPGEVSIAPGSTLKVTLQGFTAKGEPVANANLGEVTWTLPEPPPPPMSMLKPPALKAKVTATGPTTADVVIDKMPPGQQGLVLAKSGNMTASVRVRVVPQLPYKVDFNAAPVGAPPGGWVNAAGKFVIAEVDGEKVLLKVNNNARVPIAKANGYITLPTASNYTIQCDLMAKEVREQLPDFGLVANRYTLLLDGKKDSPSSKRRISLTAWEAMPRLKQEVEFDWKPDVWYRAKLTVDTANGKTTIKGKIWPREDAEPTDWTISFVDPRPQLEGSAALFGSIKNVLEGKPGSPAYFDNLVITPNSK